MFDLQTDSLYGTKWLVSSVICSVAFTVLQLFPVQALTLNENKLNILAYVESRMSFIAPNTTKVVGSTVAAKLIGKSTCVCVCVCIAGPILNAYTDGYNPV